MKILVCGASGLLGQAICLKLQQQGYEVWQGLRQVTAKRQIHCDFSKTESSASWQQKFAAMGRIDLIINAAGTTLNASQAEQYQVHYHAPKAMFEAACRFGLSAYIQISALGQADLSHFIASKHALDLYLQQLNLPGLVLRPSLVVAEAGLSSRHLRLAASLPRLLLPAQTGMLQPIALSDVLSLLLNYVSRLQNHELQAGQQVISAVGPERLSLLQLLQRYRRLLGLAPAAHWTIPNALMNGLAVLASALPGSLLSSESWRLLRAGNLATAQEYQLMQALLGRPSRSFEADLLPLPAQLLRSSTLVLAMRYASILVLSCLWLLTAWLSFAIFPRQQSYQMLAALAIPPDWQAFTLNFACGLDLLMGIACLFWPKRLLWLTQAVLICAYSGLIALGLPEYWLHPFAPILKNLPILLLLGFLYASQDA